MALAGWAWLAIALASLMAASWVYTRWHIARARRRRPPTGERITVDGVEVHLTRQGQGPPVLMLHGLAGFLEDFTHTPILTGVDDGFEAIVLDRPGYGASSRPTPELADVRVQADWLVQLVDELGLDPPIVVGHSLGGALAMAMAVRHPSKVRGLVLLAPYVYPYTEPDDWIHGLPRLPFVQTAIAHLLVVPVARLLEPRIVSASFEPQPIPAEYHELWLDLVTQPDHFDTTVEEVRAVDPALATLGDAYPGVGIPTVILTGTHDASVDPQANAEALFEVLPNAELVWLEGYGHMVPWSHPERVVEAVRTVHDRALDPATGPASTDPDAREGSASGDPGDGHDRSEA